MTIALLYNEPTLTPDHADYAQEAGVLESVEAFDAALRSAGHEVVHLGVRNEAGAILSRLTRAAPDCVVNLCEGFAGRTAGEAHVAGLLELAGIPYTGSGPECLGLVRDKARTKWLLAGAGLPTAPSCLVRRSAERTPPGALALVDRGRVIVKPAAEDASLGLDADSVVSDGVTLARQIARIHERYGDALVEQFIEGREFNVGVIALPQREALPLAEIEFDPALACPIVTYDGKWDEESLDCRGTSVRCPAQVEPALAERLRQVSLAAFAATGCRDYARVDLRASTAGEVFILEVNGNPDAGPTAGLARALRVAGIEHSDFVRRLVETAMARGEPRGLSPRSAYCAGINPAARGNVLLRPLRSDDRPALVEIVRSCGMFREDEIAVADEVLEEACRDVAGGDYRCYVAEAAGRPIGWSCHGLVPLTDGAWDLYWIAVAADAQGHGVGQALLRQVEQDVRAADGRWLLAETSGHAGYAATRRFYERAGYGIVGDVPDFYRPGDSRVTYGQRL